MKGIMGLVVAGLLGVMGIFFNWMYLSSALRGTETVSFIGIASGTTIRAGDEIKDGDLVQVQVPKQNAEQLAKFAAKWDVVGTVIGTNATRSYQGNDLVLTQDLHTPSPQLTLAKDEDVVFVTITSQNFVPEHVDPGEELTFIFPNKIAGQPTPASVLNGGSGDPPPPQDDVLIVGPFRVASIGNRTGSYKFYKASNLPMGQSRQLGLIAKKEGNKYDAKMMRLLNLMGGRRDFLVSLDKSQEKPK